ncbi:MAG: 1,2-phenylacetyl-CoA epoxidase subunit PaaC [Nocardioides sp.]
MSEPATTPLVGELDSGPAGYVLALGDDALVAAQRTGLWISRAPELEEDLAMANIGLDQLGQARLLLSLAGELEGAGRTEDDLAYFRDERAFRNVALVERAQDDFGVAMVRLLLLAAYQVELYAALCRSADPRLAAIAAKAVKEVRYHLEHAALWVVRLGDGTEESHRRVSAALTAEWPYIEELFDGSWVPTELVEGGFAADHPALREPVLARIGAVLAEATLAPPDVPPAVNAGRRGRHTESLGHLLAEMQHLARSHPGRRGDRRARSGLGAGRRRSRPGAARRHHRRRASSRGHRGRPGRGPCGSPTYSACPRRRPSGQTWCSATDRGGLPGRARSSWCSARPGPRTTSPTRAAPNSPRPGSPRPQPARTGPAPDCACSDWADRNAVPCPRCASAHARELSRFGATTCTALRVLRRLRRSRSSTSGCWCEPRREIHRLQVGGIEL